MGTNVVLKSAEVSSKPDINAVPLAGIMLGGIVQGLYGTGGPPLVWSLGFAHLDRHAFRSSISLIWFVVSTLQATGFFVQDVFKLSHVLLGAFLFPAMMVGYKIGDYLRNLLPEWELHVCINLMLAFS